ncbi:MAG: GNAT family N-acetyltransferase [Erysipelotrichaceae bacterium]|nr:GNAT family N-acetyltransferase [Erysipelotrichaceae bacterium]
MIRQITDLNRYRDFVIGFIDEECFCDPHFLSEDQIDDRLFNFLKNDKHIAYGAFEDEEITGLFVFLELQDEKYMELLGCFSRNEKAYEELIAYFQEKYPGYQIDFVFNPKNLLLKEELKKANAQFDVEQYKMSYTHKPLPYECDGIILLNDRYQDDYLDMHNKDLYWTGEKVIEAPERFKVLIALEDDKAVGYVDVTYTYDDNEPADLFVREEYRRKGYGRKLLTKAIKMNEPKDMSLHVDIDNIPALNLYRSLGFVIDEKRNEITANLFL